MAVAQPQIAANGVLNAASNAYVSLPNSSIAQGSIFSIYGANLGPASSPALAYPLQSTLGGVSVQVTSESTTQNAIPIFVSPKQVNAVLPDSTPPGAATVTVTYNGQTSNAASFQVIGNSFGIFTFGSTGAGAGIITNASNQLYTVNSPANPGNLATIWGTGLGASPGDDGSTAPPQIDMPNLPLSVYVGTQQVTVTYRGRSVFTGEDQINFVVPSGITGCYVPVAVQLGNVVSNFVTMPIAPAGQPCPDAVIQTISNHPPPPTGSITLTRTSTTTTTDSGSAFFGVPFLPGNPFPMPTGTCTASALVNELALIPITLDAGPAITVHGPNGSEQLPNLAYDYSAQFSAGYLDAGAYTISAPGGADVGPFSRDFTVPTPLAWTNQAAVATIDRSSNLALTWTGGDPTSTVQITGVSSGAAFICQAKTSDQHFTIPAFVLLSLPASSGTSPDSLTLLTTSATAFTASSISSGTINSTVSISQNVTYH